MWKPLILLLLLIGFAYSYVAPLNNQISIILDLNYSAPSNTQLELRLWDTNATPPEPEPILLSCTFNNLGNLTKYEYHTNVTINCTTDVNISVDNGLETFRIDGDAGYYLIDLLRLRQSNDGSFNKTFYSSTGWTSRLSPDSYSCNSQWSVSYPCANIYDNNTATYGKSDVAAFINASSDTNYTTYGNITYYMQVYNGATGAVSNVTLMDKCNLTDKLQWRVESFINDSENANGARWLCINNSVWNRMYFVNGTYPSAHNRVYDLILWQYANPLAFSIINTTTDIYNVSINITGTNSPSNIRILYGTSENNLRGFLNGNQLTQQLISGLPAINLTFARIGRQLVYLNISTTSLDTQHALNFSIKLSGFNTDTQNFFDYTETFNDTNSSTNRINPNATTVTSPLTIYDNMEYNESSKELWDEYSSCQDASQCVLNITQGTADDYYYLKTEAGGDITNTQYISSVMNVVNRTLVQFNLDLSGTALCWGYGAYGDCSAVESSVLISDGANTMPIKSITCSAARGYGTSCSASFTGNISVNKIGSTQFAVYENDVYARTISASTLTNNNWSIQIKTVNDCYHYSCGYSGSVATASASLKEVRLSGAKLNNTLGNYSGNGSVVSTILFSAPTNISTALLYSVEEVKPSGTNIKYEVSNNGTEWKIILPSERTGFTSIGNKLFFRANLTTGDTHYSPELVNYRLAIVPSSANNISIDIGYDGSKEYNLSTVLNESNSPLSLVLPLQSILAYKTTYCSNLTYCNIPIAVSVGTAGTVMVHNTNFTTYLNPVSLSTVYFDRTTNPEIGFVVNNGAVMISDIKIDYLGNKNLSLDMTSNSTSMNYAIQVIYSRFNASLPINISWYDVLPKSRFDKNVSPYGQKNDTPIWMVKNQAQDTMDVYIRLNVSLPSTINVTYTLNNTNKGGVFVNSSPQKICSDIPAGGNCSVWNFWNFMNHTGRFYLPVFYFSGICSDCTLTDKYWLTNIVVD